MRTATIIALGLFAGVGCSLALDFDSELDLPCPCKPEYVCLRSSNICALKGSVDDYKSCTFDAEVPDDLCHPGSTCIDFKNTGPKCLPECLPQQYITPEAANGIRAECAVGRNCFQIPGAGPSEGVCYEGECTELANDCAGGQRCVSINGAGVCFTPCKIFAPDRQPCLGGQACHPLGATSFTACIRPGLRQDGEVCTEKDPCAAADPNGRPLVCDRPAVAGAADVRRCRKICQHPSTAGCDGDETCVSARLDVDPDVRGVNLGLCIGQ